MDEPTQVRNLKHMDQVLGWNFSTAELAELINDLNDYVVGLRKVPVELRKFLGVVARRAAKMEDKRVVRSTPSGTLILISDLSAAFSLGGPTIADRSNRLDA